MKQLSYNREIKIATAQFLDIFNDILIDRKTDNGIQQQFMVPCLYGGRSRILKSQENRNNTIKPPIITILKTNFSRDTERVHSVNDGLNYQSGASYNIAHNIAVPVTINYEVSIMTKFQDDMDQIISNFSVFFNPDIYVVWNHPYNLGKLKAQIIWNGIMTMEYPLETSETNPWRIIATTNFDYKTWMFPGKGNISNISQKLITKINLNDNFNENQGLTRFYEVPTYMTFEEYAANVSANLIQPNNYDQLQVIDSLSGNYWFNVIGKLSGNTYNPKNPADLPTLINNVYNTNLLVYTSTGINELPDSVLKRELLADYWTRMLSGDLSSTFPLSG